MGVDIKVIPFTPQPEACEAPLNNALSSVRLSNRSRLPPTRVTSTASRRITTTRLPMTTPAGIPIFNLPLPLRPAPPRPPRSFPRFPNPLLCSLGAASSEPLKQRGKRRDKGGGGELWKEREGGTQCSGSPKMPSTRCCRGHQRSTGANALHASTTMLKTAVESALYVNRSLQLCFVFVLFCFFFLGGGGGGWAEFTPPPRLSRPAFHSSLWIPELLEADCSDSALS